MIKKVVIVAPTGMLGSAVYNILKDKYELVLLYRNEKHLELLDSVYGGVEKHTRVKFDLEELYNSYLEGIRNSKDICIKGIDAVINCAGITKPQSQKNPELTFFINGAFPQLLSEVYKEKLIQIATDCVFEGSNNAPYNEESIKSPTDLYGLSKSLGEPTKKSLVLRTSIIGEELHTHTLLIDWFKKQAGEVFGFTNHYWNGITTKQFAKICNEIISNRDKYPKNGLFHLFSTDITKYELLLLLKEKYHLDIAIKPKEIEPVDRRLRTVYDLNEKLQIPSIKEMIEEL